MDPSVDFAVLDCTPADMLRAGLCFDHCHVSIIMNVPEDRSEFYDVEMPTDMVRLMKVVARSTFGDGYAILNADDDLVYAMATGLTCQVALFSLHDLHGRLQQHRQQGGLCVTVEHGIVIVYKGVLKTRMARLADLPMSSQGDSEATVRCMLAAVLVGTVQRFKPQEIQEGLRTFVPLPESIRPQTNIFHFPAFDVMIDDGRNTGGFVRQKEFARRTGVSVMIGILAGLSNQQDEDIWRIGFCAAEVFNELIVRMDKDQRGRKAGEIEGLLREGMQAAKRGMQPVVIADESEAVRYALARGRKGAFIMIFSDDVAATIACVHYLQLQHEMAAINGPAVVQ
jgi:cyanophycin synthetase